MIIDTLNHRKRYEALHPLLGEAFRHLVTPEEPLPATGKRVLREGILWINSELTLPKRPEEARLEAHRRYIDIQVPFSAPEMFGYAPVEHLSHPLLPYDAERDILFYDDPFSSTFTLMPGMFAIFFPEDAHAPGISPSGIRKAVAKVKIEV